MYLAVKHLHITLAIISISLFVLRAWWSVNESPQLQKKWVKIVPHIFDTALLGVGVYLMLLLQMWPTEHSWIAVKLLALVAYILVGTVAIKRGKTRKARLGASVLAVLIFVYMFGVARAHHPVSWWLFI